MNRLDADVLQDGVVVRWPNKSCCCSDWRAGGRSGGQFYLNIDRPGHDAHPFLLLFLPSPPLPPPPFTHSLYVALVALLHLPLLLLLPLLMQPSGSVAIELEQLDDFSLDIF